MALLKDFLELSKDAGADAIQNIFTNQPSTMTSPKRKDLETNHNNLQLPEGDSNTKNKRRTRLVTHKQKQVLFSFMQNEEHLRNDTFAPDFNYKDVERKWMEITEILNAMPGHTGDWKYWKQKWKSLNKKARAIYDRESPKEVILVEHNEEAFEIQSRADESAQCSSNNVPLAEKREDIMIPKKNANKMMSLNYSPTDERAQCSSNNVPIAEKTDHIMIPKKNANKMMPLNYSPTVTGIMEEELLLKERYYEEKLNIMKRDSETRKEHLILMKRDVEAKEKIARALEMIITNNSVQIEQ